jgi:hypothetical protein
MSEDCDESIITASGKMVMLDRLLKKLKVNTKTNFLILSKLCVLIALFFALHNVEGYKPLENEHKLDCVLFSETSSTLLFYENSYKHLQTFRPEAIVS